MTPLAFLEQLTGWWDELARAKQVFFGIGIIAGFVAIVLGIMGSFGADHDDAFDAMAAGHGHDHDGIFSVKTVTGFFLGFGWAGGIALNSGFSLFWSIVIALFAGGVMMAVVIAMFRAIGSMRSDGTVRIAEAVGAVGTVYITIPAKRGVGGQVIVNFSGRQETLMALSAAEVPLASGEKVKVVSQIDSRTVLVEAL